MTFQVFKDIGEVSLAAARLFAVLASERANPTFNVVLSGGNTPRRLLGLLGSSPHVENIPWRNVHLFFGDERCVPANDPESNYGMVRHELLSRAPIPEENVHPIDGSAEPKAAAERYAEEIRDFFKGRSSGLFDLVLLGLGEDCHTLSLFEGTAALEAPAGRLVVENYVEKLSKWRVTMTPELVNSASVVAFLVSGSSKAKALKQALAKEGDVRAAGKCPARAIRPESGVLHWLVDKDSAALV